MFDHPFPVPLDYAPIADTLRLVVEAILKETCIYGNPEPAEADRPDLPYSMLEVLSDTPLAMPYLNRTAVGSDSVAVEDVQETHEEFHQALVRLFCYGNAAVWRANLVAAHYASSDVRALWGPKRIQRSGPVVFAPRLIGHHHERAAYQDFQVRHTVAPSDYLYSIKTVIFNHTEA
jgi:hypothetical protein